MSSYIRQFDDYKEKIPEFVVKLYHILEMKEYKEFICWASDDEIIIKNGKKLEDKVLPNFFRHRHLTSFIRQLNMYKFSKVHKLTKQRNHMYFKNQNFKRGQIKEMMKIKRNNKKSKKQQQSLEEEISHNESEISINNQLQANSLLVYKQYVKNIVKEISENLKKIESANGQSKNEISSSLLLCNELLQNNEPIMINFTQFNIEQSQQNKNMLSTMKILPKLQSLIFPSQCSFYHFT